MAYFRPDDDDSWWDPPPRATTADILGCAYYAKIYGNNKKAYELLYRVAQRVTIQHNFFQQLQEHREEGEEEIGRP